ncbi:angiopoietin like 4 [Rhinolophus ferrumequinum]|uniref:Angiopoietin like 4 n=1 Tax=Rhinolophus ferrumequinum TaxID=59479 RepID=A0A7J7TYH7_RHIFE|nr:angiopoietin like 4 [Rhinolophus ferrumequinum]
MRCAPTAGAALVLCAATAGFLSAQGHPAPPEPPQRFASWDEMNVLAHGLLQLGHGLREHVERTRGQLGALERRLSACGAACEEPRASAAPPNVPASLFPGGETAPETLRSLQTQLKAQNNRIEQLFQKVAQQQRHLEKQHLRIQNLQSQVGLLAPKHLDHRVTKPARRKRLPKMAQLVGPAHNISHHHADPAHSGRSSLLASLLGPIPRLLEDSNSDSGPACGHSLPGQGPSGTSWTEKKPMTGEAPFLSGGLQAIFSGGQNCRASGHRPHKRGTKGH